MARNSTSRAWRTSIWRYAERLRPFVADTTALINGALDQGRSVLFEGAQGTMLDIDFGTYPFVTSSNATSGGACTGLGVAPTRITGVAGVTKAYTTRVGSGPFPTEMPDLEAGEVRSRGKEYGAVTGRPRRCGWLDLVILRYAVMLNGITSLVVTKLDVFDTQREIQVCVGYRYKGSPVKEMPAVAEDLAAMTPEYRTLPGWLTSTEGKRNGDKLPSVAEDYLKFISDQLGVEIGMISTGPERDATIVHARIPDGVLALKAERYAALVHGGAAKSYRDREGAAASALRAKWWSLRAPAGACLPMPSSPIATTRPLTARRATDSRCAPPMLAAPNATLAARRRSQSGSSFERAVGARRVRADHDRRAGAGRRRRRGDDRIHED